MNIYDSMEIQRYACLITENGTWGRLRGIVAGIALFHSIESPKLAL